MSLEAMEKYHRKKAHDLTLEECHLCGIQRSKCHAKQYRHNNRLDAAIELVKINVERKKRGATPRLALYQCRWCDQWHYTTPSKRGLARRTKAQVREEMIIRELERRRLADERGTGLLMDNQ